MINIKPLLFSFFVVSLLAVKGIDISAKISLSSFKCAFKSGYEFAIIRGSRSNGRPDSNMRYNIQNANRAGLQTDLYIYPCIGKNATEQINTMISSSAQQANLIDTVWIDIEYSNIVLQACDWLSYSPDHNCQFIEQMISAIKSKGKKVGIYTNMENWRIIFGDVNECSNFSSYRLWYARYNDLQSFSDFKQFGGWSSPYMKQYKGNAQFCSMNADLNWRA